MLRPKPYVRLELLRFSFEALDLSLSLPNLDGDLLTERCGVAFLFLTALGDRLRRLGLEDLDDCRFLALSGDRDGERRRLALIGDADLLFLALSGDQLGDLRFRTLSGERGGDRLDLTGDLLGERRLLGFSGDRDGDRRFFAGDWWRLIHGRQLGCKPSDDEDNCSHCHLVGLVQHLDMQSFWRNAASACAACAHKTQCCQQHRNKAVLFQRPAVHC